MKMSYKQNIRTIQIYSLSLYKSIISWSTSKWILPIQTRHKHRSLYSYVYVVLIPGGEIHSCISVDGTRFCERTHSVLCRLQEDYDTCAGICLHRKLQIHSGYCGLWQKYARTKCTHSGGHTFILTRSFYNPCHLSNKRQVSVELWFKMEFTAFDMYTKSLTYDLET